MLSGRVYSTHPSVWSVRVAAISVVIGPEENVATTFAVLPRLGVAFALPCSNGIRSLHGDEYVEGMLAFNTYSTSDAPSPLSPSM